MGLELDIQTVEVYTDSTVCCTGPLAEVRYRHIKQDAVVGCLHRIGFLERAPLPPGVIEEKRVKAHDGLKQIQIQSVWNSTDALNFEVGGIHVRPIDQTRDDVIFELNANNFRTGYVESGFDGFVINDFNTISIDADSYGRLGMTWVSTDFDHETHDIVVRAKRGPDNTADAFRVGFKDEDGLEGLADLSGEDFFFEFSTGDFSTDDFTAVRMPFTEFELVEDFGLWPGDEAMNFGAFAVMLETIEGDSSRFNMEIESIQIVQRMPEINGDYDGNGVLDSIDVDAISEAVRSGRTDAEFDINRDGQVDNEDLNTWVVDLKMTYFGDANLDGEFNSGDLVAVFQAGEYENNQPLIASWATGDWNGDGKFTSGDLVAAFQDGSYEQGPRLAANAVPEPASVVSLFGGLMAAIAVCRRRRDRSGIEIDHAGSSGSRRYYQTVKRPSRGFSAT